MDWSSCITQSSRLLRVIKEFVDFSNVICPTRVGSMCFRINTFKDNEKQPREGKRLLKAAVQKRPSRNWRANRIKVGEKKKHKQTIETMDNPRSIKASCVENQNKWKAFWGRCNKRARACAACALATSAWIKGFWLIQKSTSQYLAPFTTCNRVILLNP